MEALFDLISPGSIGGVWKFWILSPNLQ